MHRPSNERQGQIGGGGGEEFALVVTNCSDHWSVIVNACVYNFAPAVLRKVSGLLLIRGAEICDPGCPF